MPIPAGFPFLLGAAALVSVFVSKKKIAVGGKRGRYLVVALAVYLSVPTILYGLSLPVNLILKAVFVLATLYYSVSYIKGAFKGGGLKKLRFEVKAGYFVFAVSILLLSYLGLLAAEGYVSEWSIHYSSLISLFNDPLNPTLSGFQLEEKADLMGERFVHSYAMYMPAAYAGRILPYVFTSLELEQYMWMLSVLFFLWNLLGLVICFLLIPYAINGFFGLMDDSQIDSFYILFVLFTGLYYGINIESGGMQVFPEIPSMMGYWQNIPHELVACLACIVLIGLHRDEYNRFPLYLWVVYLFSNAAYSLVALIPILLYMIMRWILSDRESSPWFKAVSFIKGKSNEIWFSSISTLTIVLVLYSRAYMGSLELNIGGEAFVSIANIVFFLIIGVSPFLLVLILSRLNQVRIPGFVWLSMLMYIFVAFFRFGSSADSIYKAFLPPFLIIAFYSAYVLQDSLRKRRIASVFLVFLFSLMIVPSFISLFLDGYGEGKFMLEKEWEIAKTYVGGGAVGGAWVLLYGLLAYIAFNTDFKFQKRIDLKPMHALSVLYISFPALLFFFYLKSLAGAVAAATLLYILKIIFRSQRFQELPSRKVVVLSMAMSLIVCFLAGLMPWIYGIEQGDWRKHNMILADMIEYSWPVTYESGEALNYYIAYYLPAAFVGKALNSLFFAKVFISFFTAFGLFIAFCQLIDYVGLKRGRVYMMFFVAVLFVSYSGWDWLCHILIRDAVPEYPTHLEWGVGRYIAQYTSFMAGLAYAPQHLLPALMLVPVVVSSQGTCLLFVFGLSAIWSPFVTLGLFYIYLVSYAVSVFADKRLDFSIQDVVLTAFVSVPAILFYLLHNPSELMPYIVTSPYKYSVFIFTELGAFTLALMILWRRIGRERVLVVMLLAALILMPLFKYGRTGYNDFLMRTSMPMIVALMYIILSALVKNKNKAVAFFVIALLLGGAVTPIYEVGRVMKGKYLRLSTERTYEVVGWTRDSYLGETGYQNPLLDALTQPIR